MKFNAEPLAKIEQVSIDPLAVISADESERRGSNGAWNKVTVISLVDGTSYVVHDYFSSVVKTIIARKKLAEIYAPAVAGPLEVLQSDLAASQNLAKKLLEANFAARILLNQMRNAEAFKVLEDAARDFN